MWNLSVGFLFFFLYMVACTEEISRVVTFIQIIRKGHRRYPH